MMKTTNLFRTIRALGMATSLFLGAATLPAQDGPPPRNFDPAQMRARMLERMREAFDVKDEAEWQALSGLVAKVLDTRRALRGPGGPGGFGGPGGPPPRGNPSPGAAGPDEGNGPTPSNATQDGPPEGAFRGPPRGGPGGFNAELSPEAEALRKAIEAKAPSAELKSKLAEFKAARQKKQAELEKAQDELRQVLTVHQEAVAVMFGLL